MEMGLIGEDQHPDGSFVLTKAVAMLALDYPEVLADSLAEGVRLHVRDVLPRDVANWIRVLRDADRTSRIGIGGAIEIAFYLGCIPEELTTSRTAEELFADQNLCDWSVPINADEISRYDEKPEEYFNQNILPLIKESGQMPALVGGIETLMERIYGVRNLQHGRKKWQIEPVSPEAQFLVGPRVLSMNRVLRTNGYSPKFLPDI